VVAGALQHGPRASFVLRQQLDKHMQRFYILIVVADRMALRICQRFLQLGRQFIHTHCISPLEDRSCKGNWGRRAFFKYRHGGQDQGLADIVGDGCD
jgi:hypothetical protein